ncbi:MAG: nitrate reductase cytochrome c-type subunit; periplasmic nitrate reductase electron transfer subunit [Aquifex sp.]|nr:MAG: nitrate reductase cytochrome c-type subunit; periplasmic nitrate reductase electron transfer subunit [Aquifex sp.]
MKAKKIFGTLLGVGILACSVASSSQQAISPEELGIRKAPVEKEVVAPPKVEYPKAPPGQAKRFQRAYENAPPLIPHSIEGMFPITLKNNACLGCHMPDVAKQVGATPLPPTHFIDFYNLPKGKILKLSDVDKARWNCLLCHRPQANVKPIVKNLFKPEYRNPEAKQKSYLYKVIYEGAKPQAKK